MYFPGQKLNETDVILQNLSAAQQAMVIAKRQDDDQNKAMVFNFDIVLRQVD
jgi:protocatechuate 3,4-dioxygenase beta subunit